MEKYITDIMLIPGGSHTKKNKEKRLVHGKRIQEGHPLFRKLFPYRCKNYGGPKTITVTNAVYNWIKSGNEIRKGEYIVHLDGNNLNDDIDNLDALTIEENRAFYKFINTYKGLPVPLIKAYIQTLKVRYRIGGVKNGKQP